MLEGSSHGEESSSSRRPNKGKLPTRPTTVDLFVLRFDSVLRDGERNAALQSLAFAGYDLVSEQRFSSPMAELPEVELFSEPTASGIMAVYGDTEFTGFQLTAHLVFGDSRAINFAKALALFWGQAISRQDLSLIVPKKDSGQQAKLDVLTMVADGAGYKMVSQFRDSVSKKANTYQGVPPIQELSTTDILDLIFESPLPSTSDDAAAEIHKLTLQTTWRLVVIGRRLTDVHSDLVGEKKFRRWFQDQRFSFSEKSARRYMNMYAFLSTIPRDKVSLLILGKAGRPLITEGACALLGSGSPSAGVLAEVLKRCEAAQPVTMEFVEGLLDKPDAKKAKSAANLRSVWSALQSKPAAHPLLKRDEFRNALGTCVTFIDSSKDVKLHKLVIGLLNGLMKAQSSRTAAVAK